MFIHRRAWGLVVIALAILINGYRNLTDAAASGTRIAGTLSCQTVKQEPLPLDAEHGSLLLMEQFACTNTNKGPTDFMAGAEVTNQDVAALFQGNGPQHGYITFKNAKGETAVAKWSGQVQTTMNNGQPAISFYGTWEHVQGSGQYEGIHGRGSYHGQFTGKDTYTCEWVGQY